MSTETKAISDRELRRREKEAARRLAEISAAGDPGAGLPSDAARVARDERILAAQQARADVDAARARLAQRQTSGQTFLWRLLATTAADKRRRENTPMEAEAERKAFHAELAKAQEAKNEAERERKRAAGLLYELTGEGGGDVAAALFSSSALWAFTEMKIQKDVSSRRSSPPDTSSRCGGRRT